MRSYNGSIWSTKPAIYFASGSVLLYFIATLSKASAISLPSSIVCIELYLFLIQSKNGKIGCKGDGASHAVTMENFLSFTLKLSSTIWLYAVVCMLLVVIMTVSNDHGHGIDLVSLDLRSGVLKLLMECIFQFRLICFPAYNFLRPHYSMERAYFGVSSITPIIYCIIGVVVSSVLALLGRPALILWMTVIVATLVPSCGLIHHAGIQITADRYGIVPLLCTCPLLCAFIYNLLLMPRCNPEHPKIMNGRKVGRTSYALLCALAVICGSFAIITSNQIRVWKNDDVLWTHALSIDKSDWRSMYRYYRYSLYSARFKTQEYGII